MSHTKGPWHLISKTTPENANVICEFSAFWVAVTNDIPYGSVDDDAALIRSAPDLLAALEAVEWVSDYDGQSHLWLHRCPWCRQDRLRGHAPDCPRQLALKKAKEER